MVALKRADLIKITVKPLFYRCQVDVIMWLCQIDFIDHFVDAKDSRSASYPEA